MKSILLLSVSALLLTGSVKAQLPPASASEIMKQAYEAAARENKNVFLMFHASWCGWCHKMDNSMNDPACQKFFNDNYVVCHLVVDETKDKKNLENPGADELREKYHGDGIGIPFWLLFDKNGNLLADSKMRAAGEGPEKGENTGCPASEKEVDYFISILKKTSTISDEQSAIIRKRFRENDQ